MVAIWNALSFALLALAAVSYPRWRRRTLAVAGVLFFPATAVAVVLTWWPVSPLLAIVILAVTLGIPLGCLALFGIDVIWAPFCMEMTYVTVWCWILCPLAVMLNYVGMAVSASWRPS